MQLSASVDRPPALIAECTFVPGPSEPGLSVPAWRSLDALERVLRVAVRRLWQWRTGKVRLSSEAIEQARLYAAPDPMRPYVYRVLCRRIERVQTPLPGMAPPDLVVEAFGQAAVFLVRALADLARTPPAAWGSSRRFGRLLLSLAEPLGEGEALELAVPDGTTCRLDACSVERTRRALSGALGAQPRAGVCRRDATTAAPCAHEPGD